MSELTPDSENAEPETDAMRLERTCRIIRVKRTVGGFQVVGELYLSDVREAVHWRVLSFAAEPANLEHVEEIANRAGQSFARHIPTWFNGSAFFVDSRGEVVRVVGGETT